MTAVAERRVNTVDVEIVVPVFNEEADLGPSVLRLHAFLQDSSRSGRSSPSPTTPAPMARWQLATELAAS